MSIFSAGLQAGVPSSLQSVCDCSQWGRTQLYSRHFPTLAPLEGEARVHYATLHYAPHFPTLHYAMLHPTFPHTTLLYTKAHISPHWHLWRVKLGCSAGQCTLSAVATDTPPQFAAPWDRQPQIMVLSSRSCHLTNSSHKHSSLRKESPAEVILLLFVWDKTASATARINTGETAQVICSSLPYGKRLPLGQGGC